MCVCVLSVYMLCVLTHTCVCVFYVYAYVCESVLVYICITFVYMFVNVLERVLCSCLREVVLLYSCEYLYI